MKARSADIELVAFDLGGVPIDRNPCYLHRRIFAGDEERVEWFLRSVCPPEWNAGMDAGRPFAEGIAERIALLPELAAEIRAWFERWPEMLGGPIAGSVALFEALVERGVSVVALAKRSAETFALTRALPEDAFLDRFACLFVSGELRMVEPDPAIFRHMLERTGVRPGACLFVDDTEADIRAARGLGMETRLFRGPEGRADVLRDHGLLR